MPERELWTFADTPRPRVDRSGPQPWTYAFDEPGRPRWRPLAAAGAGAVLPGLGHALAGRRLRAAILIGTTLLLLAAGWRLVGSTGALLDAVADPRRLRLLLAVDAALLLLRCFGVVDAWRVAGGRGLVGAATVTALLALVLVPHAALGYVDVRGTQVLEHVFARSEPADVPAASPASPLVAAPPTREPRPVAHAVAAATAVAAAPDRSWVTILLLGGDAGWDRYRLRTDTMIAVALQHGTGRAVAVGVPRNLVEVPLAGTAGVRYGTFREMLNGLYEFGQDNPSIFPPGRDAGATALKQTLSQLLGLRLRYYALVDLAGFARVVDLLGGIDFTPNERISESVSSLTRGGPRPSVDVVPGRTYHFDGATALAYARSRESSSDYDRMGRQRCLLSALARQADPLRALRGFSGLASVVEQDVSTDIPLARVPDLVRLVRSIDPRRTITLTAGPPSFVLRWRDGYPVPDAARIRAAVRAAVTTPARALASAQAHTAAASCGPARP